MVAPSLDILGGQAVQADRLLGRLREVPWLEVSLQPINPRLPGPFRKLQRIKYVRTILTEAAYVAALLRHLPRCEVVHAFSASYFSFLLAPTPAIVLARLFGKPVILNYRSGEAEDHLRRWRRTAVPTVRLASEVIVPSGYLVDVFARFGVHADSICNIVDLERFQFRDRDPMRPVFFANRNLEPLYNVACVIRAFARIQREFPDARLTLAGDGSEHSRLEALTRDLKVRNVEFLGRIPPERMSSLYDAADIFLNGSDIDNMPASILEAFAAGLPVITTRAGGIPYIVRHEENGLLVDHDDDAAMAREAIRLLKEPRLARGIVRRAREECQARYTWTAVRDEWLKVYMRLADGREISDESSSAMRSGSDARMPAGGVK